MSLSVTYSDTKDDLKLADSDEGLIGYSLTTIPSIPIYNVDGSYSSVSQEGLYAAAAPSAPVLPRPFLSRCVRSYKAATFFSSFVIARLIKSLMVVPVEATKAATRECNSDGIRRFSLPL